MRILAYFWAAPCSAIGLLVGFIAILLGASGRLQLGVLEIGGGRLGRMAARQRFQAITLGHVILGIDHSVLAAAREHERVHVRQYERWGLLFFPAYALSSLVQLLNGRDPYLDNRFEREAYGKLDVRI